MKLYQFNLPLYSTELQRDHADALGQWQKQALSLAGGFTRMPEAAFGKWMDDDGKVYTDCMVVYQVGCTETVAGHLLDAAFRLFPEEKAMFVACVGTYAIHDRNKVYAPRLPKYPREETPDAYSHDITRNKVTA